MTIAQYYNEATRQMEVPIVVVGAADTDNYISFCSLVNTTLATFTSIAVNWDKVMRWDPTVGFKTAYIFDDVWYGAVADVEPIEAGVGYVYIRKAAGGSTTWIYDCEFFGLMRNPSMSGGTV